MIYIYAVWFYYEGLLSSHDIKTSLLITQVKWTFYTPADLKTPSNTDGSLQNDGNLIITSSTTADKVRKDLYNVDACIKP